MVYGYVLVVTSNRDYGLEKKICVDSFYQLEYMKYFDRKEDITRIWKLMSQDFDKLENLKKMPSGTIKKDMSTVRSIQMRARFAMGDILLVYGDEEWTSENLSNLLNSMDGEELQQFIKDAKF